MNKNKKITLLTSIALLTTVFATGCGSNPEKIESNIEKFAESHENISAALTMDSFLIGLKEGLGSDNIKGINFDKYFVFEEVLKEEQKNLKSIKNKELKNLNKIANQYYEKSSKLIEELTKGDLDFEEFIEEADELAVETFENLEESELIDKYNELREKAEMDEYDLDSYVLFASYLETFKDNYKDDIEKILEKIVKKNLNQSGLNINLNNLISSSSVETSSNYDNKEEDEEETKKEYSSNSVDAKKFVESLAKNSKEEKEVYGDDESASIYLYGSSDGKLEVFASTENNKLDYITCKIDGSGDEEELSERMISTIKKFCKEADLDEDEVFKSMRKIYKETSSKEFLNSSQAKEDLKEYNFVTNIHYLDDMTIDMIIFNPNKSLTKKVEFTIMKND